MEEKSAPTLPYGASSTSGPLEIRILGAGHFGYIAARRLSRKHPGADILVVDTREDKLREIQQTLGLATRMEDAIRFLGEEPLSDSTWIVPAVPVHVAYLWALHRLKRWGESRSVPVPEGVDSQVPNPYRVPDGTVYTSFATFRCPDACSEPDEICTYTKQPRPGNLFEVLSRIKVPGFHTVVVRSLQLAPGVGGYTPAHLKAALQTIRSGEGGCLVGTSCRCHGVLNALQFEPLKRY